MNTPVIYSKKDMLISQLVDNLESQIEVHQVLLDVLNQEGELPASCSLMELEEVQSVRDITASQILDLETARFRIIEEYKRSTGISSEITLREIAEQCEKDTGDSLFILRDHLTMLIQEIREAGKRNAERAITRKTCFNEIQEAVHKSFHRHSVYSVNGVMSQPRGAYLVQKAI